MSKRLYQGTSNRWKDRTGRKLSFERLEQRAMMALDVLDGYVADLQADYTAPDYVLAGPQVASAPSIAKPLTIVGGSTITGQSANLSILGQHNEGESDLKYTWQTVTAPSGAPIRYLRNNDNLAKSNTLTFKKPGDYGVRVTITDLNGLATSSELRFRVVSTLTSLSVRTSTGATAVANARINSTGPVERFTVVGLDQFGRTMPTASSVSWRAVNSPSGSRLSVTTSGTASTATFNRTGVYGLRVSSGNVSHQFDVNVQASLKSLSLRTSAGNSLNSSKPVTVKESSTRLIVTGVDQFNRTFAPLPSLSWTVVSKPSGGNAKVSMAGSTATVSFTGAGSYTLRIKSGSLNHLVSFDVKQSLTSIRAANTSGTAINTNGLSTNSLTQSLQAVAYDQFGKPMKTQPKIAWNVSSKPSGASPALSQSANNVTVRFSKAGAYVLRASVAGRTQLVPVSVGQLLTTFSLAATTGANVQSQKSISVNGTSHRLTVQGRDQFGSPMVVNKPIAWTKISGPSGGSAKASTSGNAATISFTRAGTYVLRASAGGYNQTVSLTVNQVFRSIAAVGSTGQSLSPATASSLTGTSTRIIAQARDQFGQPMKAQPTFSWSSASAPSGGTAAVNARGAQATVSFSREGNYTVRIAASGRTINVPLEVASTLTRISVATGSSTMLVGAQQNFSVQGFNQFQRAMTIPSSTRLSWTSTLGTITSSGTFTAGSAAGSATITARVGSLSATTSVRISTPTPASGLRDASISSLVTQLYADGELSRVDVIGILRSAGADDNVNATELTDLRFLVSANSNYAMPTHVRELGKDVVNSNPANLRYRGQSAGNLVAGSSAALLNNLVDKWFLGTDLPSLTSSNLSYRAATGTLFASAPALQDAKQGALGDCYFIASVASIAQSNPDAVRNMFIDNGDGTFTVRFYAGALGGFFTSSGQVSAGFRSGTGTADYVTVNTQLPTYWNGTLAYSGRGLSAASNSTTLWIALAEKAYSQWNETGNSGRDGTNRYQAIEGGWMSDVNAQVLGYNSTSYSFNSSTKQSMIAALNANRAITLGTIGNAGSGLVGGHAYVVTGYNASTDRFTLFNPWGNTHPSPLTWAQLQANCTQFVVVDPTGSIAVQSSTVRSDVMSSMLVAQIGTNTHSDFTGNGASDSFFETGWSTQDFFTPPTAMSSLTLKKDSSESYEDIFRDVTDFTSNRPLEVGYLMDDLTVRTL
ncbi:C2 family cysteine protease [Neorhodopirellula pilleata]|nr:C2 family cysteine protease [Neorhodopirellula pilleata]